MTGPVHLNSAPDEVRQAEARAAQPNPSSAIAPLDALRTVVLFTITDAFALCPEESTWAGYHLDRIFAPLLGRQVENVPISVRQEMLEGTYTQALNLIESNATTGVTWDQYAAQASVNDWASVTLQMVGGCYPLSPLDEAAMHAEIVTMLRDLGVDHPTQPRQARYLPSDLRHRLGSR